MSNYSHNTDRPYWVGVDFDDTCVFAGDKHPEIGGDMPGAAESLREMVKCGCSILLITSREGMELHTAKKWFEAHGIPLADANHNPDEFWKNHRKIYADILIDDRAAGVPRSYGGELKWGEILRIVLEAKTEWHVKNMEIN